MCTLNYCGFPIFTAIACFYSKIENYGSAFIAKVKHLDFCETFIRIKHTTYCIFINHSKIDILSHFEITFDKLILSIDAQGYSNKQKCC